MFRFFVKHTGFVCNTIALLLLNTAVALAFITPPSPSGINNTLTCNVPVWNAINSNVQIGMIGTNVTTVVGIDRFMGGVGAKFELRNNAMPNLPQHWINILENRSGAGAGWQTSYLIRDNPGGVGIIVGNQAAGNSVSYQWGYSNSYGNDGNNLWAGSWNPLPSDHIHEVAGGHSPCIPNGYLFDDGAVSILGQIKSTPNGTAIEWKNTYKYKSRMSQSWPNWYVDQGFYLNRAVARSRNLRLYLKKGTYQHPVIRPHNSFTINGASCVNSTCNAGAYDYALFVWNIDGLDIGVAIPNLKAISLLLEKIVYCGDPNNDTCGNISFHSWLRTEAEGPVSFSTGQIRSFSKNYIVGTLPQLSYLGYKTW